VPEKSPDASPVYPEIERQYNKQQLELSPLPELPVGEPPYAKQPASYQDSGAGQDANLPEQGVAEPGLDRRSAG
jgi:hypothetical protein